MQPPFHHTGPISPCRYMLQHVHGFVNKYIFLRPNEVSRIFQHVSEDVESDDANTFADISAATEQGEVIESPPPSPVRRSSSHNDSTITIHMIGDEVSEQFDFAMEALADQMNIFVEGTDGDASSGGHAGGPPRAGEVDSEVTHMEAIGEDSEVTNMMKALLHNSKVDVLSQLNRLRSQTKQRV